MISCREIHQLFDQFSKDYAVQAVAYGGKEVSGQMQYSQPAISFFVDKKLPKSGQQSRLSDGRRILPSILKLQTEDVVTDVIPVSNGLPSITGVQTGKKLMTPGGKLKAGSQLGTMACLVKGLDNGDVFAITNEHVAQAVRKWVYFKRRTSTILRRRVSKLVLHEPDEDFLQFVDQPNALIRVDAALVGIKDSQLEKFTNQIPHFGKLDSIFSPNSTNLSEYRNALVGKGVYSYSWKSKKRFGEISHVYGVIQELSGAKKSLSCFLVRGKNGISPGLGGDSGKPWLTKVDGKNSIIGLHFGEFKQAGSLYAVATDFQSLADYWSFDLYPD